MRWDPAREAWTPGALDDAPVAVDSWLVDAGRVRGWELHWARFARACAELAAPPLPFARVADATAGAVPTSGHWFPRIELHGGGELALLLRPAPARAPRARLWPADRPDDRRAPRRKGADLALLEDWRAAARRHGADEALLLDGAGRALEAGYASLLWWEEDTLVGVPEDAPVLAGVTRALILELAAARGVELATRLPRPAELLGRELWAVNALHGIRAVSELVGLGTTAPPARAAAWQAELERLAVPVSEIRAG